MHAYQAISPEGIRNNSRLGALASTDTIAAASLYEAIVFFEEISILIRSASSILAILSSCPNKSLDSCDRLSLQRLNLQKRCIKFCPISSQPLCTQ
jgi:hypothetical protein